VVFVLSNGFGLAFWALPWPVVVEVVGVVSAVVGVVDGVGCVVVCGAAGAGTVVADVFTGV
jgi:hypothetical protein